MGHAAADLRRCVTRGESKQQGDSQLAEIQAVTFPGNVNDFPVQAPTATATVTGSPTVRPSSTPTLTPVPTAWPPLPPRAWLPIVLK